MSRSWPWVLGLLVIGIAIAAALMRQPNEDTSMFVQPGGSELVNKVDIEARNLPVVARFVGELADGGKLGLDRTKGIIPFVIGDEIKLDAEVQNTVEYRWAVNGIVLKEKELEWSTRKDRDYTVEQSGVLKVELQVRGSDPRQVSQPKVCVLRTEALVVESFEPHRICQDDHVLTGSDYIVVVDMLDPVGTPLDYYKFRYLVNGMPMRHPDDPLEGDTDGEWCAEKDFTYTFPAPGHYTFTVEVRRAASSKVEATKELGLVVVAADAVLSSFDASPEKNAPLGTDIELSSFRYSILGNSEVRYGFRKLNATDFEWIVDEKGAYWGESKRTWKPKEPGNYLLRAEAREEGKEKADDFREIQYTITDSEL